MSHSHSKRVKSTSRDRQAQNIDEVVSAFIENSRSLAQALDAPDEVLSSFIDSAEDLAQLVGDSAHTTEQNQQDIDELTEHSARERADTRSRVSEVEETIEEAGIDDPNPTPNSGKTTIQQGDLTPIEQLSRADDPSEVTDSPSVERAVSLFQNLPKWGSKTPKGIVLKPADNPLSLLEADRDESLAWKQYYRAAETLEQLSHGSVTFFDSDRHGKMICLHEQSEAYDRIINGSLTASSVEAEG